MGRVEGDFWAVNTKAKISAVSCNCSRLKPRGTQCACTGGLACSRASRQCVVCVWESVMILVFTFNRTWPWLGEHGRYVSLTLTPLNFISFCICDLSLNLASEGGDKEWRYAKWGHHSLEYSPYQILWKSKYFYCDPFTSSYATYCAFVNCIMSSKMTECLMYINRIFSLLESRCSCSCYLQ